MGGRAIRDMVKAWARRFGAWYRVQPWPLRLLLLLTPLLIGKLVDEALKRGEDATGVPQWMIASLLLGTCLAAASLSLSRYRQRRTDSWPPIDMDEIEVRRTFPPSELRRIREGLHNDLYGGVAPNGDQITAMYARNPCMGVALYDSARADYVAFATGWPLTDEAAGRLIAGLMTENELTADDILPAACNGEANYVLVPAFGAADGEGAERKLLGFKLNVEFKRTLRQNFFPAGDRLVTLIASGFSEDGRRWCRRRGMVEQCQVRMEDEPEPVPVFTTRISLVDVS